MEHGPNRAYPALNLAVSFCKVDSQLECARHAGVVLAVQGEYLLGVGLTV
jgi:hypothetical protein